MAWHSYYLQGLSVYQDYYDAHVIDQNSAYSMDQGAMGAPRDFAISIVPLIYLRPDLAKDALRFMARSQNADNGKLPYSYFGHGKQSGAVIHALSSDLDLFFLWALQEYLAATRDFAFLDEVNAYYPKSAGESGTIENHARRAFTHLRDEVGLGEHGLIKSGTGDWNDVLVAFSDKPIQTIAHGESGLNAGFAAMILPKVADLLRGRDADLADEMDDYAADQVEALQQLWMGDHAARGYLGYDDTLLGDDRLFVDTQAWAVLGGAWTDEQTTALFDKIKTDTVDPEPTGALSLWPPEEGPCSIPDRTPTAAPGRPSTPGRRGPGRRTTRTARGSCSKNPPSNPTPRPIPTSGTASGPGPTRSTLTTTSVPARRSTSPSPP
ncbi:MAG: hypothetical protein H6684_02830 [Deltaproteobacteria bacterium]|nr:hypothetical protein [Deltaproteobacteria bacterium]